MHMTPRNAPIIGALLMLCACAESATAPATLHEAGETKPLDIVVPALTAADGPAKAPGARSIQRTSTVPLPPELEGVNVPSEYLIGPGITGYDVIISIGEKLVTAYAWMTFSATAGHLDLDLSTVGPDARPGISQTATAEDLHLYPSDWSLNTIVNLPFLYSCGAAATARGRFTVWHQFPGKLGNIVRWGDYTATKSVDAFQEPCPETQTQQKVVPMSDAGGSPGDKTEREDPSQVFCVYIVYYVNWVEVGEELVGCYTA